MFALPYAGGSASIYRDWIASLNPILDVCPFEYAGHAGRFGEPFFSSIEETAEDVSEWIRNHQTKDYIIYGHSMGSLVALETEYVLERKNIVLPKAIVVAACRPPHLRDKGVQLGRLSKTDLMKEMVSRGQYDSEILEDGELFALLSDVMYADIQMYSQYKRSYNTGKIHVPIIALAGELDQETPEINMQEWHKYTESAFAFHVFSGNHFFAFNDIGNFAKKFQALCNLYMKL